MNYGMQVQLPEVTRAVSVYYAALVLYTLQDCCYVEHEGSTVRTWRAAHEEAFLLWDVSFVPTVAMFEEEILETTKP